jgi:hypothetical protein
VINVDKNAAYPKAFNELKADKNYGEEPSRPNFSLPFFATQPPKDHRHYQRVFCYRI